MAEPTYAGKLGALARFIAALAANASDLPHLDGVRSRIEAILAEAQGVSRDQAALVASKQEASQRIRVLLTEGDRLMTGTGKLLKQHYGLSSEKLAEFHLQPFRGRNRRINPTPQPAPEDAAPASDLE